jgi:DNA-binding beta-propeller fold protein YncE
VAVGLIGGVTQIFLAEGDPGTGVAQVRVLDGSGNPVTAWSSLGAISFVNPYGVATAGTTLFVLDNNGGTNNAGVLYAFNWDGTTLTSLASTTFFNYPEGVAVYGTTVYVSDTYNGNGTVDQFTFTGSSFTANGQSTGGSTAFLEPSGLAFNSAGTTVFVADAGNDLIQENSGSGWVTFASTNNFSSDDSDIYGVGVDSQGNVYACDVYNGLVQQFNSNGNYLSFATGGSGTAAFSSPDGIALLGSHLIVSDYSNGTGSPYGTGSLVELIP